MYITVDDGGISSEMTRDKIIIGKVSANENINVLKCIWIFYNERAFENINIVILKALLTKAFATLVFSNALGKLIYA